MKPKAHRVLLHSALLLLAGLWMSVAHAERRVALVIGNSAYGESPLRNPVNDARDMRDRLLTLGFDKANIVYREDLKTAQIGDLLREWRRRLEAGPDTVALVFYAGHGVQIRGENFLPTIDARIEGEEDVPRQALKLAELMSVMAESKARMNLVLLDACRNNPYARGFRDGRRGLAQEQLPTGTLISYATRSGSVAADGGGRNGVFTAHLLANMSNPGVPVELMLKKVSEDVYAATKSKQEPWQEGSIRGYFYFASALPGVPVPGPAPAPVPSRPQPAQTATGAPLEQPGQPVKIGLLATLDGPFAAGGTDGMRGAELAVKQRGGTVAGRKIEIIKGSSDAKPEVAVNATRKLVEQDKVDIMVGPLAGGEGIAVKDYSKTQPQVTFINGASGAQATTLVNPSPNFFRFNTEGAQWMVGLGKAALDKGYKRVMVIAEDYAFPYSQVQGFMSEYCRLGGKVPEKAWVPLGGKDYSSVIAKIPKNVDALLVVLGGADTVNFLNQYEAAGGDKPILGGSITVSQDVLNYRGKRRDSLVGTLSAGPMADAYDGAEWKAFVADYQKSYPVLAGGFPSPSLFAYIYYVNMKAALDGLDAVNGDLSGGQAKYREALSKMVLKTPSGDARLDANRQVIGTTFVTEVVKDAQGNLFNKVHRKVDGIEQLLGMKKEEFQIGSRDVPACP